MNGARDNPLWMQMWREQHTEFHQTVVNPLLNRFWPALQQPPGSRVFVPLCGKSLDMLWLAQHGHEVVGVEVSPIAVRAFFAEQQLQPTITANGNFSRWQAGNITILCGDYFALSAADLGRIDSVYDRAALTALSEDIRGLYVAQLCRIVPVESEVFLLTIEDAGDVERDAQVSGVDQEIAGLYGEAFTVELAHVETVVGDEFGDMGVVGMRAEGKVYRLRREE